MKFFILAALTLALLFNGCSKLGTDYSANLAGQCQTCHRTPPKDRIHDAHAEKRKYNCNLCHPDCIGMSGGSFEITGNQHVNNDTDVVFSTSLFPLQRAVYSPDSKSCAAVYCHGYFEGGDSAIMRATDTVSVTRCLNCHNVALMQSQGHLPHTPDNVTLSMLPGLVQACQNCHAGYSYADSGVNESTHINGIVEPVSSGRCQVCHNLPHTDNRTNCVLCHVR